jgi:hypothetical protein
VRIVARHDGLIDVAAKHDLTRMQNDPRPVIFPLIRRAVDIDQRHFNSLSIAFAHRCDNQSHGEYNSDRQVYLWNHRSPDHHVDGGSLAKIFVDRSATNALRLYELARRLVQIVAPHTSL